MITRLSAIVFWLSLMIWTAAIVASGAAAALAFTVLPEQSITLSEFSAIDQKEHGRIAAGILMDRMFAITDWAQFIAAPVCLLAMVVHTRSMDPGRKISNALRFLAIIVAIALLGVYAITIRPVMNGHLHDYWTEAKAGKVKAAEEHRAQFNEYHPRAELIAHANLDALLIAIAASAVATTRRRSSK